MVYRKKIKFPGQDLVRCLRKCGTPSSQTSALPLGINRSRCWTDSSPSTTTPTGRTCAAQRWKQVFSKAASHSPYRDIPAEQRGLPIQSRSAQKGRKVVEEQRKSNFFSFFHGEDYFRLLLVEDLFLQRCFICDHFIQQLFIFG